MCILPVLEQEQPLFTDQDDTVCLQYEQSDPSYQTSSVKRSLIYSTLDSTDRKMHRVVRAGRPARDSERSQRVRSHQKHWSQSQKDSTPLIRMCCCLPEERRSHSHTFTHVHTWELPKISTVFALLASELSHMGFQLLWSRLLRTVFLLYCQYRCFHFRVVGSIKFN